MLKLNGERTFFPEPSYISPWSPVAFLKVEKKKFVLPGVLSLTDVLYPNSPDEYLIRSIFDFELDYDALSGAVVFVS